MQDNIFNSKGVHVGVVDGPVIFDLDGNKLYDLKGTRIYQPSGEFVGLLDDRSSSERRLGRSTDWLFPLKKSRLNAALALSISVGIIVFGVWVIATDKAEFGEFAIWFVLGFLSIAVGWISLLAEIRDRRIG